MFVLRERLKPASELKSVSYGNTIYTKKNIYNTNICENLRFSANIAAYIRNGTR